MCVAWMHRWSLIDYDVNKKSCKEKEIYYLNFGTGDPWALQVKATCVSLDMATFSVASDENFGDDPPIGSKFESC